MKILDPALMERIATGDDAHRWLILEEHPEYPGQWQVNCLNRAFLMDFIDMIGPYKLVSPATLEQFVELAEDFGYKLAFGEDPLDILKAFKNLNDPPPFSLNSTMGIQGFLPFQLQGFNKLKDLKAGVAKWSTGTGKTVLASALVKYHLPSTDYAWVVVKTHNKINTQRTLLRLAGIDSVVLDGPQNRRHEVLTNLREAPAGTVIITNYEKFRIDEGHMIPLFEGKRVLMVWDEMPTKLKNRSTKLYKSVRKCLYRKVDLTGPRPADLRQYMLSATPIENGPEDWYNCVRLLDPSIYGPIKNFRDEYVATYNPFSNEPDKWRNLDKLGLKAAHVIHEVDKESPDIAKQFPAVIETPYIVDWHKEDRAVYDLLASEAKKSLENREFFDTDQVLSLISVMQMLCCAPSMVSNSAARFEAFELAKAAYIPGDSAPQRSGSQAAAKLQKILTRELYNDNHTKLLTLKELLTEDHRDEKVVIFSAFNEALMPILQGKFKEWGVTFVRYDGTQKVKQFVQDKFCDDPNIQVFLSSDQGSDSISLEPGSVVIHYDLPWKWSTFTQRQNRIHRVTSTHESVRFYTLMMANSVEERKHKILEKKKSYHDQVFKGAKEEAESARMTREDLLYILTG